VTRIMNRISQSMSNHKSLTDMSHDCEPCRCGGSAFILRGRVRFDLVLVRDPLPDIDRAELPTLSVEQTNF